MASIDVICCGGIFCNNLPALCCGLNDPNPEPLEVDGVRLGDPSLAWARRPSNLPTKPPDTGKEQVVLLLESLTRGEVLAFQITVLVTTLVLQAYIITMLVLKIAVRSANHIMGEQGDWFKAQLIVYSCIVCGLVYVTLQLGTRLWGIHKKKETKEWTFRRRIMVVDAVVLLGFQFILTAMAILPLGLAMTRKCPWYNRDITAYAYIREITLYAVLTWMCMMVQCMTKWRGRGAPAPGAPPLLLVDAPWSRRRRAHLPIFIYTACVVTIATVHLIYQEVDKRADFDSDECPTGPVTCTPSTGEKVAVILSSLGILGYSVMYLYVLHRATKDHKLLPYAQFRLTFLYVKMHARHGSFVVGLLTALAAIVQLIEISSCWSFIFMQFGTLPIQVAFMMLVTIFAILLMPRKRDLDHALEDWVHEVAWTEEEKSQTLVKRREELASSKNFESSNGSPDFLPSLPELGITVATGHLLAMMTTTDARNAVSRSAMLCFETLVKMFYYCRMAYRYGTDRAISLEHGMSLFPELMGSEVVEEVLTDTRAFLAWGPGIMVVSFRGTVSRKNVVTDLKVWSVPHQPTRRGAMGRVLKVHAGFYRAWRHNGFGDRLLARIAELAEGQAKGLNEVPPRMYFTGHSLGGALAVLASIDLSRTHPVLAAGLSVYTFGAPRVGNGPFVQEHLALIPDTWAVVNDQDPVPRLPKGWYYNAGSPVVVNSRGDLIVRPSEFDILSFNRSGGVAADHRLNAYALSSYAILQEQFGDEKGLPGGDYGVIQLAARLNIMETLTLNTVEADTEDSKPSGTLVTPVSPADIEAPRMTRRSTFVVANHAEVEADALQKEVDPGTIAVRRSLDDSQEVELALRV